MSIRREPFTDIFIQIFAEIGKRVLFGTGMCAGRNVAAPHNVVVRVDQAKQFDVVSTQLQALFLRRLPCPGDPMGNVLDRLQVMTRRPKQRLQLEFDGVIEKEQDWCVGVADVRL